MATIAGEMTSNRRHWPGAAIGALILITVIGAGAARWQGGPVTEPDAPVIAARDLRFTDQPDGSIAVFDAASGRLIDTVVGEAGFIRGALRGLARERRRHGIGAEPPFRLLAREDGRLTLVDSAVDNRIDLEAFGPTNAGDFARWLAAPVSTSSASSAAAAPSPHRTAR